MQYLAHTIPEPPIRLSRQGSMQAADAQHVHTRWPLIALALAVAFIGLVIGYDNWMTRTGRAAPSTSAYLREVDHVCVWRNGLEDDAADAGNLFPARVINLSRTETDSISVIPPPDGQAELRTRILSLKKTLDSDAIRLWNKADRSRPKFKRFWDGVATPRLNAETTRMEAEFQRMGLPDCSNYGPAPAPSLLPKAG
jgi:hypothetical protein